MLNQQTIDTLNIMKLFGMARGFEDRLNSASQADLSHAEFVGLLAQDEKTYRDNRGSNACSRTPNCVSRPPWKTSITVIPEA